MCTVAAKLRLKTHTVGNNIADFLLVQLSLSGFTLTSCARGDTICLRPLQVDSIFAFIRQVAPVPARWLFNTSATS